MITKYHPDSRVTRLKLQAKLATMLLLPLLFITAVNTILLHAGGSSLAVERKHVGEYYFLLLVR
jgi:hypothetical protein